MVKVARVIPGPVRTRFGDLYNCCKKRVFLWLELFGDDLHLSALCQARVRGQHHHTVLDCAFVAHASFLPGNRSRSKPVLKGSEGFKPRGYMTRFFNSSSLTSRSSVKKDLPILMLPRPRTENRSKPSQRSRPREQRRDLFTPKGNRMGVYGPFMQPVRVYASIDIFAEKTKGIGLCEESCRAPKLRHFPVRPDFVPCLAGLTNGPG
jgi:hypothetical protein